MATEITTLSSNAPALPVSFSIHNMELTKLPPLISEMAARIPFRNSLIKDYYTCPQMMMYRWLYGFEEEESFFSGVMGTAGHEVIYNIHNQKAFDLNYTDMLAWFNQAFEDQVGNERALPKVSAKFDTLIEQRDAMAPEYIEMLQGYMKHRRNHKFYSTIHEQKFVLVIDAGESLRGKDEFSNLNTTHPFVFTGQIDQGGYYEDGSFALRDLKFRAESFRPSKIELMLDTQISIYAYAMRYGLPSCDNCQPIYEQETNEFKYNGPCAACNAKIGKPAWPQKYPEVCEMIWMRDFLRCKKDQYANYITDKTRKVKNPKTGRMVFSKVINPEWVSGKKKGEYRGIGFMATARPPGQLEVLMSDILRTCHDIRKGVFYRRPSTVCEFWCKHRTACLNAQELTVDQANVGPDSNFMTLDPFGES